MASYDYGALYALLKRHGASNHEANVLSAIALAESGGNSDAGNDTGIESSFGLFQINTDVHFTELTQPNRVARAKNPDSAADYALGLYRDQGERPWSVTHGDNPRYKQFLQPEGGANLGGGSGPWEPPHVGGSSDPESGGTIKDAYGVFRWPTWKEYQEQGHSYSDWMTVVGDIAVTYAGAGMAMPAGAPDIATAAYNSAIKDQRGSELDIAMNQAKLAEINAGLARDQLLLPYDLQKMQLDIAGSAQALDQQGILFPLNVEQIRQGINRENQMLPLDVKAAELANQKAAQDIELAKPFGSEQILRTGSGQQGWGDYWSGRPLDPTRQADHEYSAGFNLARSSDEPRQNAISGYLDRVIDEMGMDIEARGVRTTQVVEEIRGKLSAFETAGNQMRDIMPWTIPTGSEYVPGHEPGGLGESIGAPIQKATPIHYDPFQMANDILASSPKPTDVGVPEGPNFANSPVFDQAMQYYNDLIGGGAAQPGGIGGATGALP